MKFLRVFLGSVLIGLISLLYNYLVFLFFDFYPDLALEFHFLEAFGGFYLIIFLKNFFVGFLLIWLFGLAYSNISKDQGEGFYLFKGVFYFTLYAIVGFFVFGVGDIFLMDNDDELMVLFTLDGFLETFIMTFPIRIFSSQEKKVDI